MDSELVDGAVERSKVVERAVAKRFAREDAEPDLDLIEPAAVLRREHEANPSDASPAIPWHLFPFAC